jgi:hypothetical protein
MSNDPFKRGAGSNAFIEVGYAEAEFHREGLIGLENSKV